MRRELIFAGVMALAMNWAGTALSAATDYVFEPVSAEVKRGDNVVVAVRLKHKATGKPVADAVIIQTRIDMAPDNMAEMDSPLAPVPSKEPGVYAFKTELSMAGRWLLSIAAKVQGEPETVVGKVIFRATR
jgi:hypothetical protein